MHLNMFDKMFYFIYCAVLKCYKVIVFFMNTIDRINPNQAASKYVPLPTSEI